LTQAEDKMTTEKTAGNAAFPEGMTVQDLQSEMAAGRLTSEELTRRCLYYIRRSW
jgi:hypothetical protein